MDFALCILLFEIKSWDVLRGILIKSTQNDQSVN